MNEHTGSSPVKSLFPKNALITPSASPPGSRFFFSSPIRDCVPPPAKKRRFASTASSSSFSASTPLSSSSSRLDPIHDLHDARRASSLRVLDVWSSLAARYNRRLDEDDIIDLRTGDVVKDRGVIRELPQEFEIGHFADADDPLNLNDASSEGGGAQTEAEDDIDEIDAFAPESDITKGLRLETRVVPPVQVMNPADADDLREFMEAERLRRELDGEEEESSEDDFEVPVDPELDASSVYSERRTHESDQIFNQELDLGFGLPVDDDSEDEFAAWGVDEGNTIYQVVSEPELHESPLPSPPHAPISLPSSPIMTKSPPRKNRVQTSLTTNDAAHSEGENRSKTTLHQAQLHTPPQSASSVLDNSLDDIDIRFPPPQIRVRAKSIKQKTSPGFSGVDSDFAPSPEMTKSKKVTKREPKPVSEAVIACKPVRTLQTSLGDELASFDRRLKETTDKEDLHGSDPQSLFEFEEGLSTSHNRDRPQKPRKKSSKPDNQISNDSADADSPSVRAHKRKRATSTTSKEDFSDDAREKSSHSAENVRIVTLDDSSDESDTSKKSRPRLRPQSAHQKDSALNSYPYSIPYMSGHKHSAPYPPTFQPIQDPNAQFIIAQAMHQLAYLVAGPQPPANGWSSIPAQQMLDPGHPPFSPTYHPQQWPFTPTHHWRPDMDPLASSGPSSSNYNTPNHPHPYSYMFTPSLSRNTLPPSSPDRSSSPIKSRSRSKYRGRRVSFKLDPPTSPTRVAKSRGKGKNRKERSPDRERKTRDWAVESSEEEKDISEDDSDIQVISSPVKSRVKTDSRKAMVGRGRTPGPSSPRDKRGRQ